MDKLEPSFHSLRLIAGSSHPELAQKIAAHLGTELVDVTLNVFASGERQVMINESVRGADVFLLQTHTSPVNDNLVETLLIVDALKRAAARSVTLLAPFYPYARQDRKDGGREPISAQVVANLFNSVGVDRLITIDLHTAQIQGFFPGVVDHLGAIEILTNHFKTNYDLSDFTVVSPDAGRVKVSEKWTDKLGVPLAIIHKRRSDQGVKAFEVVGEVRNRKCLIVDDMIDTASTLAAAITSLKDRGAAEVTVAATHGIFSKEALNRLEKCEVSEIVVTDTLPQVEHPKLKVVGVDKLLANAIRASFEDRSFKTLEEV